MRGSPQCPVSNQELFPFRNG